MKEKKLLLGLAGVALFLAGFLAAVIIWWSAGEGAWRSTVGIHEARINATTGQLDLIVESCNGAPKATAANGEEYLEVTVRAFNAFSNGEDCLDSLTTWLPQGVTPTVILDLHTGKLVEVLG